MFDAMPPGPVLASELDGQDVDLLDSYDLVEMVQGWERVAAWVAARQMEAIDALHHHLESSTSLGSGRISDAGELTVAELRAACHWGRQAADSRVGTAWSLCNQMPGTLAALREGRIDASRARVIVDRTMHLEEEHARRVENAVLARAERTAPAALRRLVDRAVIAVDPAAVVRRREKAAADRDVFMRRLEDGMAEVCINTSAESAVACMDRIKKVSAQRHGADDERSVGQRRSDAAVGLLLAGLPGTTPLPFRGLPGGAEDAPSVAASGKRGVRQDAVPSASTASSVALLPAGVGVTINVTVPLSALVGVDSAPAELDGYGPIPAQLARDLATSDDATWRRLITDPLTGGLLDAGRSTYRPPANLDRYVRLRDRTCRFPGCNRSAQLADLDHTVRYPEGPTSAANLSALCRYHHRLKHRSDWQVETVPSPPTRERRPPTLAGLESQAPALLWTSPTGHVYATGPHRFDDSGDPILGPVDQESGSTAGTGIGGRAPSGCVHARISPTGRRRGAARSRIESRIHAVLRM